MAYILNIEYHRYVVSDPCDINSLKKSGEIIQNFPVIVKKDGTIWQEGNAYLSCKAQDVFIGNLSIKTVRSYSWQLLAYLQYCEHESLDPMHFGAARHSKPSYLFRGHLVRQKKGDEPRRLASSTASARINAVTRFLEWSLEHGWLDRSAEPFREKYSMRSTHDRIGFERRHLVRSTDLAIRKSRTELDSVEGGLRPVSAKQKDKILKYAKEFSSVEFSLMLEIGFQTGLRIQSICGLHTSSFIHAIPGEVKGIYYFNVGPKYDIPTKFGVNYRTLIPESLLIKINIYINSQRRTKRVAKAKESDQKFIFLNRWGKPYHQGGSDTNSSISQDLHRLKKRIASNLDMTDFYFHCTRATFGTSIVMAGLNAGIRVDRIINTVRQLLGHKDASTTLKYISFVENMQTNEKINEEFQKR